MRGHETRGNGAAARHLAVVTGCGDDDDGEQQFEAAQYAGTYEGTWTNGTSGASGPASIEIDIDEDTGTAVLTIDFGGNYLGLGDPPPATLTGTFDDERAVAKGQSDLFGAYDVTIEADGAITGVMENLAGGATPKMTYTGSLTADRLDADYVVELPDGSKTTAVLRLEKQ